jgi:putative AlgH/UPF0301 family transcriptional regulator
LRCITTIPLQLNGNPAGQLECELDQRFWFMIPEDTNLVFDHDRDKLWDDAMKRRTQDL